METKKIWFANPVIKDLEWMNANTLGQSLGINVTEIGDDYIVGTMPVDERTKQPFGLLHGGASVALDLLINEYVSNIHINDIDLAIYSFWYSVLKKSYLPILSKCLSTSAISGFNGS